MDTTQLTVGDLTFDALVDGPEGAPLVLLLHGFPQTSWSYRHQLPALAAAGYRAVAPDQRGYSPGARPPAVEAYRSDLLVADVLGMADALGADRFHLVGHDWGGAVAWQVAGRHAERLISLTVLSTPHPGVFGKALSGELGGDQAERSGYMEIFRAPDSEDGFLANDAAGLRMVYLGSGLAPEDADRYVAALGTKAALGAALNWYRAADLTLVQGMGPITTPTMYIWSTDDVALGREPAEATADFVEGPYRFETLDGISHWVAEHAPERVNELLLSHLASTR